MKVHIKAPLPSAGGKARHGASMPSVSWMEKQLSKPGPKFPKAPKSPYTAKQSAKIEKSLRAGGDGGKVYKKRLASISKAAGKGMGKQRHKPAGSPAGGQFF